MKPVRLSLFLSCALLLLPIACGGGGGGGAGVGPGPEPGDPVETSLNKFGISTAEIPRQQEAGVDVPDDYSPHGATWEVAVTKELLILGMDLDQQPGLPVTLSDLTDENGNAVRNQLFAANPTTAPWALERSNNRPEPATLRSAVAADFDGDGLQEVVVIYQTQNETRAWILDDATTGHATMDMQVAFEQNVTNVAAAAGDFDGDGDDDIAVGLTQGGIGELLFLSWSGTAFEEIGTRKSFAPLRSAGSLAIKLATGNLDYDRSEELALTVNEREGTHSPASTTRYAVLDDLASDFAILDEGDVTARTSSGTTATAITASVAIGDIDGDNLDEVVLGGVEQFARFCTSAPYVLTALDDAEHGLARIAGHRLPHDFPGCDSPEDPQVRTVHVHALDIDDDGVMEIVANKFVFEDFAEAAPWTAVPEWELPNDTVYRDQGFGQFDDTTSSFVVGDFTGDNRDDIAVFHQDVNRVRVFGLSQIATQIEMVREIRISTSGSQTPVNPVLLPVNVDMDGPVLKYSDAEYKLVWSEPVVIAALAAAPCREGIGQNVQGCFTSFGNTTSTGSSQERSVSFSASASVGVKATGGPLTQSEFELKDTATLQSTRKHGTAYSLSKSILFNSAPAEDTVVFTSVPIDQYIYEVVSHPDPTMVGRKITVNMPREPVTRQAEREFFNRTVPEGSIQVDETVFTHAIGDVSTYPNSGAKNALLAGNGGLEVGPIGVAQGGGSTTLVIQVGREISSGGSLSFGYERQIQATGATVLGGISIGTSTERSWQVTSGRSTTYTGQVGGIPASSFSGNQYQWGLFTYVHTHRTGEQFEVVSYWVEE